MDLSMPLPDLTYIHTPYRFLDYGFFLGAGLAIGLSGFTLFLASLLGTTIRRSDLGVLTVITRSGSIARTAV